LLVPVLPPLRVHPINTALKVKRNSGVVLMSWYGSTHRAASSIMPGTRATEKLSEAPICARAKRSGRETEAQKMKSSLVDLCRKSSWRRHLTLAYHRSHFPRSPKARTNCLISYRTFQRRAREGARGDAPS